ncbi:unnamed protein product, partial [Rotaria sp. Silwood1]
MAKFICVMEENKPASQLFLPITDDYSISTGSINTYFPNVSRLNFTVSSSLLIFFSVDIDVEHGKFIIGEENFKLNYVYVVHRINTNTDQTTTTQIPDRNDTPPIRPRRRCTAYLKLLA